MTETLKKKSCGRVPRKLTAEEQVLVDEGMTREKAIRKVYVKKYNKSYYEKNHEKLKATFNQKYRDDEEFKERHLKYQKAVKMKNCLSQENIPVQMTEKIPVQMPYGIEERNESLYCILCKKKFLPRTMKTHINTSKHLRINSHFKPTL